MNLRNGLRAAARRLEPATDIAATVAALAIAPLIFVDLRGEDARWILGAEVADWTIWSVFALDVATKTLSAGRAWVRLPAAWLDIAILLLSFPALPAALGILRVARLTNVGKTARLMRLVRFGRLLLAADRAFLGLRRVLSPEAFPTLLVAAILVVLTGAAGVQIAESTSGEPMDLGDALWWAVVSVTSVGYGDIVPQTAAGRAVAALVMVVGIGFTSVLTAQIAAWLSRQRVDEADAAMRAAVTRLEGEMSTDLRELREAMRRLERSVEKLADRPGLPAGRAPRDIPGE